MSEQAKPDGVTPLADGELIDDRALESREEDAFRLSDIADELLGICRHAPTPATIALYASWGSGKSSLGRILEAEFRNDKEIAYTRFDALKYAETPLRRHFLSQVATGFGINDSKYGKDLYRSIKGTDFTVTPARVGRLVGVVAVAIGAVLAVIVSYALIASAFAIKHTYWHSFGETLRNSAGAVILSATALAAILALVSQSLSVDTSTEAPSSSEEFERLFKELVEDALEEKKCKRLVIFIDELDRCSPDQVVSVLETLRTFLEVKSCVFIVAADQQALERAATDAARQATPVNPGNPYYSAGSAYLDKIFQYQFPMPPLLPRRLSRFALDLTDGRPGVWQEIPNRPELVSVLIPTHVRSPRRVKALLNSFALSFRMALMRSAEGTLDSGVEERASEVAKLVCLRTEFPLFAADLQLDARLPQLTLMLRENPELTLDKCGLHGVAPEAFSRARAYAKEELPVDEVIAKPRDSEVEAPAQAVANPATPPEPEDDDDSDADEEEPTGDYRQRVETNHARQLIRYLERTKDIPGPDRDLVFLESSGAAFGLPGELAEQIETDALDGQANSVAAAINAVADDNQYYAALRLLARLVVEAIGIDAHNVLTSLFAAVGSAERPLDPVVDELLTAVASYRSGYEFKPGDLEGALRLSLERGTEAALEVRTTVLERPEAVANAGLRELILRNAPALIDTHLTRVAEVLTTQLADADEGALSELLAALPLDTVEAICGELDGDEFAETAYAVLARTAAQARADGHEELGELLLRTLIGLSPQEARHAAQDVLAEFAPISTPATIEAVLTGGRRRVVGAWPSWLDPIDAEAAAQPGSQQSLTGFVTALWQKRFNPGADQTAATDEEFEAAADSIARLAPNGLQVSAENSEKLLASLSPTSVTTQAELSEREEQIAALWSLAGQQLLNPVRVGSLVLADLEGTLGAVVPAPYAPAVGTYVVGEATRALRDADELGDLAEAIGTSPWLDESNKLILRARLAIAETRLGLETSDNLAGEELIELKNQGTAEGFAALGDWLRTFKPDPEVIIDLFETETRSRTAINAAVRAAVGEVADSWNAGEKAALFERLAPLYHSGEAGDALLRVGHAQEADATRVAAVLQQLFEASGNNDERERVLQLWSTARPPAATAQRLLADKVFIPLLGKGKDAIRLALSHFDLVQHMTGAPRDRIKKALQDATRNDPDFGKRADKRMRDAGWIKQKKPWWKVK
ncbi:MAG TPA: P-loop NTPase fold protein [Gaiellaceae bacterium]|nr:P-loop NTPase fold protein [Gaiellaceae bacterium]